VLRYVLFEAKKFDFINLRANYDNEVVNDTQSVSSNSRSNLSKLSKSKNLSKSFVVVEITGKGKRVMS